MKKEELAKTNNKTLEAGNVSVYDQIDLIVNARSAFGVHPEVVAGALHGVGKDQRFTKDEAQSLIDQFLNRKVK